MAAARLSIRNLNKSFSVPVLTNVNLTFARGEIHAIVGENGAGKTTLGSILAGFLNKDSGEILLDGVEYEPANPKDAFDTGISCATQELSLINSLSIAENIALRKLPHRCSIIVKEKLEKQARSLLRIVGLEALDPNTHTETLGLAERQLVEIAKSISTDCRVLILDEPTAALTTQQAAGLHNIITELAASGTSVIYISHRLQDVLEVSDTITVLRDGRVVTTAPASSLSVSRILEHMSGNIHSGNKTRLSAAAHKPAAVLEVDHITTKELPHEISFTGYSGEIIGIAGLSGSGRSELLNALFGLTSLTGGHISLYTTNGKIDINNARTAKRAGVAYLGEDRQSMGLYSGHSILTNMMIPGVLHGFASLALLDNEREIAAGNELVETLNIKCNGLDQDVDRLSGGNQQKVLIARWLHCNSDILLFDEPTRGIDIGAKNMLYNQMFNLRDNQKTLLVTSSEIEELMALSDRIFVLSNRKLVKIFNADDWSEAKILAACFSEFTTQTTGMNKSSQLSGNLPAR